MHPYNYVTIHDGVQVTCKVKCTVEHVILVRRYTVYIAQNFGGRKLWRIWWFVTNPIRQKLLS